MIILAMFSIIAIVIFFAMGGITRSAEKREYNNGMCPKCGSRLVLTDMDSQGGRWYTCSHRYDKTDPCDYDCWISYDVD